MAKIVCCDISKKDGDDYHNFLNALTKHSGCCQITETCWVISTSESSKQISDRLAQFLGPDDRLFVASLEKGSGAWVSVLESNDILQNILKN